jgi:hypothetical protein
LIVTTQTKAIFQSEDVKALLQKCGLRPRDEPDFEQLSTELDSIAQQCIRLGLRQMAPTPGEDEKWFRRIARDAKRLLAAFGVNKPLDELDNDSVYRLTIGVDIPHQPEDLDLRRTMAVESGAGDLLGEWRAIRVALYGLKMMMARAERAAVLAKSGKATPRKAPSEEVFLVAALHDLYTEVTGDNNWYTANLDNGTPSGPFIEFVQAMTAHIHDNLDAVHPVPPAMAKNLKALSTSPRRIAKRVRQIRKGTNHSSL